MGCTFAAGHRFEQADTKVVNLIMVQAQSLAVPVPSEASALAAERANPSPNSVGPAKGWLAAVMFLFLVVVAGASGWIFFETSQFAQGAGPANISRWQLMTTLAVAGGGAVLTLVTWSVFNLRERVWEKKLRFNLGEWETFASRLPWTAVESPFSINNRDSP